MDNSQNQISTLSRIYVAGHRGLVGSAIVRTLRKQGYENLVLKTRQEVDLRNQEQVSHLFQTEAPEYVFLAAAKVGGIWANSTLRGDFILENLQIQTHVISAAFKSGVKKLIFLGSSCIYPKLAQQPMKEDAFLTGPLEETNEAYAIAKIAGVMLCKSLMLQYKRPFISLMPTNLYGLGDNYDPENSHVLPGLIRKFHEAKVKNHNTVTAWGTGSPIREFLYADDLAEAALFALKNYWEPGHLNIGSGEEISIYDLSALIKGIVGFKGDIVWDPSKPNGTPRKLMDSTRIHALGWKAKIRLEEGIKLAYADFLSNYPEKHQ
jgi:GDP-L-fucose synthase